MRACTPTTSSGSGTAGGGSLTTTGSKRRRRANPRSRFSPAKFELEQAPGPLIPGPSPQSTGEKGEGFLGGRYQGLAEYRGAPWLMEWRPASGAPDSSASLRLRSGSMRRLDEAVLAEYRSSRELTVRAPGGEGRSFFLGDVARGWLDFQGLIRLRRKSQIPSTKFQRIRPKADGIPKRGCRPVVERCCRAGSPVRDGPALTRIEFRPPNCVPHCSSRRSETPRGPRGQCEYLMDTPFPLGATLRRACGPTYQSRTPCGFPARETCSPAHRR
jgi:hypothetical protein